MYTLEKLKSNIAEEINKAIGQSLITTDSFVYPPSPEMGDLSLPCFNMAKVAKKSPVEFATELVAKLKEKNIDARVAGPYVNIYLDSKNLFEKVMAEISEQKEKYGMNDSGENKKVLVEYACPNTHKAFHIGHLRNIFTGEAIAKIMEANGYNVTRTNYQGDVGLHIAKCLWGILNMADEYKKAGTGSITEKSEFLGRAYSFGSKSYEEAEDAKEEIIEINKKIYLHDASIKEVYDTTRQWSLDYFEIIYKKLNSKFDRYYFESEVFENGRKIVLDNLAKGTFKKSDGAVIFEGEQHGLHNRVFINSEGNPTYEAKDVGLAELQFKEFNPAKIIHVVSAEQDQYFKVVFKAIETIMPETRGREIHKSYGWVKLKDGKMSSRLGNVILGEWLLDEAKKSVEAIMAENTEVANKETIVEKVSMSAVKYSMLKNGVNKDILFDINESVSFSGNSGPYLQYTYARINSILKKSSFAKAMEDKAEIHFDASKLTEPKEKILAMHLSKYPEAINKAGTTDDPSEIAKYLFDLAKDFNDYYHATPVLKADEEIKNARLAMLTAIKQTIANGLKLLGIETVEEM